ncbi:TPA: hypothetical protein HA246_04315 [Candidatus Woesearchaeota archaeon]|nr:hypothetical protein [Candidatus Woesearchaeota archaeon]
MTTATSLETEQEIQLVADLQKGTLETILDSGTPDTQDTMPKKEDKELVFVRKLVTDPSHPDYKTDLNLVKILAEQAKLISINPHNYLQEYHNPQRGFYLMEDSQGVPISVISVVTKDTHFASFKTGTIVPIKDAVVTEAGFAYQRKRSYRILKTIIVYAMTQPELAATLGLPELKPEQHLVTKVTGLGKPYAPYSGESGCTVRPDSMHIYDVDNELGYVTIGYSETQGGPVHMTDLLRLRHLFARKGKAPGLKAAEGGKLAAVVLLDSEGKMSGYATADAQNHYAALLSKSVESKLVA